MLLSHLEHKGQKRHAVTHLITADVLLMRAISDLFILIFQFPLHPRELIGKQPLHGRNQAVLHAKELAYR